MDDAALTILRRARATTERDGVDPLRAVWSQWEAQGQVADDRPLYFRAIADVVDAIGAMSLGDVGVFCKEGTRAQFLAVLDRAIRRTR